MKNKILKGLGTLVLLSVIFTSCGKLPQVEIDAAKIAVEEAANEGANIYLQDNYQTLNDSLKSVNEAIEAKKSKLFQRYTKEIESLNGIKTIAVELKQKTIDRKEELKSEITFVIAETEKLIGENQLLILDAPKGKEGNTALVAIKGELSAIELTINDTKALVEKGELLSALDKIKAGLEKSEMINAELTEVISKFKSNVRKR